MITKFLDFGENVIVDDTNLNPVHESRIECIAKHGGHTVEVKVFDTPLEECILRDSKRDNPVGEEAIRDMYNKYKDQIEPQTYKYTKPEGSVLPAYIFDIDGTLAIKGDRSPYDWGKVGLDTKNKGVFDLLTTIQKAKRCKTIIFSGRDEICRPETEKRLADNLISYNLLVMRPQGDNRKDSIVKLEMLQGLDPIYYIKGVFDDRQQVVDMRRSIGLTCFQVAPGDF